MIKSTMYLSFDWNDKMDIDTLYDCKDYLRFQIKDVKDNPFASNCEMIGSLSWDKIAQLHTYLGQKLINHDIEHLGRKL